MLRISSLKINVHLMPHIFATCSCIWKHAMSASDNIVHDYGSWWRCYMRAILYITLEHDWNCCIQLIAYRMLECILMNFEVCAVNEIMVKFICDSVFQQHILLCPLKRNHMLMQLKDLHHWSLYYRHIKVAVNINQFLLKHLLTKVIPVS